jgi:hypothetical protein
MAEIAVLTCPVCDRSAGFDRGADGLQEAAWGHLTTHRLDESKRAIYAVMMVERSERRSVEAEPAPPTGEWTEELPAQSTP